MRTLSIFFFASAACLLAIGYGSLSVYALPAGPAALPQGATNRDFCSLFGLFCPACAAPTAPAFCVTPPVRTFAGRTGDANCTSFYCCNGGLPYTPNSALAVRANMTQTTCADYGRSITGIKSFGFMDTWGTCGVSTCGVEGYNLTAPVATQCNKFVVGPTFKFCYCTKCA